MIKMLFLRAFIRINCNGVVLFTVYRVSRNC